MWILWCIAQGKKEITGLTGGYSYRTGEGFLVPLYCMCCVGLIYCCRRLTTLVSSGITAGAPDLQVSLLYSGGNALCPLQNVFAPLLRWSEENRKNNKRFLFQTCSSFTRIMHWNVFPCCYYINRGLEALIQFTNLCYCYCHSSPMNGWHLERLCSVCTQ